MAGEGDSPISVASRHKNRDSPLVAADAPDVLFHSNAACPVLKGVASLQTRRNCDWFVALSVVLAATCDP